MKEIRNIIAKYEQSDHSQEQLALASVVNIEESAYRRIGARMLVSSNGTWVGGISGGCLEGDALRRSQKAIYNSRPSTVVYDTMDDDANQIGVGLGCNGRIEVLFTPIDPDDPNNLIELLKKVVKLNQPAILLQVIAAIEVEFLGQAKLVHQVAMPFSFCAVNSEALLQQIEQVRIKRRPQILTVHNRQEQELKILVEYLRPELRLVIVGDNYDVLALVSIVNELGWEVHLVGREKKLSKALYKVASNIYEYEAFQEVPIDDFTAVVLMTHDYNWDKKMLPLILAKKPPYIGVLGPKKRMHKIESELTENSALDFDTIHGPVGLDIGAETPEEIAISIVAEIIATFRNREGTSLKLRKETIHERR